MFSKMGVYFAPMRTPKMTVGPTLKLGVQGAGVTTCHQRDGRLFRTHRYPLDTCDSFQMRVSRNTQTRPVQTTPVKH